LAEPSNDFLYQLYRRCCGNIEEMLAVGIPDMPSKEELLRKATDLQWPARLERDGVLVDFTKIELLKARETQTIANLIQRLDQSLIPSRKKQDAEDDTVLNPKSAEFARLARLRVDVGKYYQLLLGEPTSRGETTDEERRRRLENLTPSELRDLLVVTRKMREEEESKASLN